MTIGVLEVSGISAPKGLSGRLHNPRPAASASRITSSTSCALATVWPRATPAGLARRAFSVGRCQKKRAVTSRSGRTNLLWSQEMLDMAAYPRYCSAQGIGRANVWERDPWEQEIPADRCSTRITPPCAHPPTSSVGRAAGQRAPATRPAAPPGALPFRQQDLAWRVRLLRPGQVSGSTFRKQKRALSG